MKILQPSYTRATRHHDRAVTKDNDEYIYIAASSINGPRQDAL
jgi:hypothetical protein